MVKEVWGKLSEDDFRRAEGSEDKLSVVIQQRFGETKEDIKAKFENIHSKWNERQEHEKQSN